jgi:AcrR family transcriptional regulator
MDHRPAILDAATRSFYQHGYSRATVDDIAAEAGVTKRTVYRYVGSKERLLFAVCERFVAIRLAVYPHPTATSPVEQLQSLITQYGAVVTSSPEETRVFIENVKHLDPEGQAEINRRKAAHLALLGNIIQTGSRSGEFVNADDGIVAQAILGTVLNLHQWFRPDGPLAASEITSLLCSLFLRGLGAQTDAAPRARRSAPRQAKTAPPVPADDGLPRPKYAENIDALLTGVAPTKAGAVVARILEVAGELFYEKGYDNATTREIAQAAGLSKSALYYYIDRKEEILYYLNLWVTESGVRSLHDLGNADLSPEQAFRRAVDIHCTLVHDNLEAVRVFNAEVRFLEPAHLAEIAHQRQLYFAHFSEPIRRLLNSRGRPDTHSADVCTAIIIGMLNSTHTWYSREGRLGPKGVGAIFSELVLNGLVTVAAVSEAPAVAHG